MKPTVLVAGAVLLVLAAFIWLANSGIVGVSEDPVLATRHRLEQIHQQLAQWSVDHGRLPRSDELVSVFIAPLSDVMTDA